MQPFSSHLPHFSYISWSKYRQQKSTIILRYQWEWRRQMYISYKLNKSKILHEISSPSKNNHCLTNLYHILAALYESLYLVEYLRILVEPCFSTLNVNCCLQKQRVNLSQICDTMMQFNYVTQLKQIWFSFDKTTNKGCQAANHDCKLKILTNTKRYSLSFRFHIMPHF